MFLFASWRPTLFCLSKIKWGNKKTPRCRFFPSVLAPHLGGCGTRFAQTVLAAYPSAAQAEGATKGFESQKQTLRLRWCLVLWFYPLRAR